MATLQIVAEDLTTVLFDFISSTGTGNPSGVITDFGVNGAFTLHATEPEFVVLSPSSAPGGRVIQRRDPLGTAQWTQYIVGTSQDLFMAGVGELSRLLAKGGTLKWIAHGSSETRYIDFEPSSTPWVLDGRPAGLWQIANLFSLPAGVEIVLQTQPYPYGAELDSATNLLTNGLLIHDMSGTANRPDGWTWDTTVGISGETISTDEVNWSYQFTIADSTVHNLQQTTAVGSAASGNVAPGQFEARVSAVVGTPQARVMVEYMQSDGTTQVGADQTTTISTLTTVWQQITLTPAAAGALTSRVRFSIQVDNVTAGSTTIQLRKAQVEIAAAPSLFRSGSETINYDPAGTLPRIAVFAQGTAPTPAKVKVTADADTLSYVRLSRESTNVVDLLEATTFKQLESGTLGGNTASAAVGGASASNAAQWTPTVTDPAFGTDASSGGTGNTITLTKPASLAVGELLTAAIWAADATSQLTAPAGWKVLGPRENTTNTYGITGILYFWYKIADATDVAATSFVFSRVHPTAPTAGSYRGWVGRHTNVDQTNPLMIYAFATENASATPTAATITTDQDDALIITIFSGNNSAGALTFTTPAGATPTYAEADDGTADVTFRGMSVNTGVLATAGATSTKDSTAAIAIDAVTLNVAFRKAPAAIAARSTVTFTGLPAGDYHVLLRRYPSAAARMRERIEYQIVGSPSVWNTLGDFINDVTGASAFTWADRIWPKAISIPEEAALDTLTVRVSVGLETTPAGSPLWNGDFIRLIPANELISVMSSETVVASTDILFGDAVADKVLHLAAAGTLKGVGNGHALLDLEPGLNLIDPLVLGAAAAGFTDRTSVLGTDNPIRIAHSPRYRT